MKIEDFKKNQNWIMEAFLNNKNVAFIDEYGDIVDKAKCIEIRYAREIMFVSNIYQVYPKIKQIKTKPKFKKYKDLVMQLLEDGYKPKTDSWELRINNEIVDIFRNEMFQYCGRSSINEWSWNPEWLEEVEVDEM